MKLLIKLQTCSPIVQHHEHVILLQTQHTNSQYTEDEDGSEHGDEQFTPAHVPDGPGKARQGELSHREQEVGHDAGHHPVPPSDQLHDWATAGGR